MCFVFALNKRLMTKRDFFRRFSCFEMSYLYNLHHKDGQNGHSGALLPRAFYGPAPFLGFRLLFLSDECEVRFGHACAVQMQLADEPGITKTESKTLKNMNDFLILQSQAPKKIFLPATSSVAPLSLSNLVTATNI